MYPRCTGEGAKTGEGSTKRLANGAKSRWECSRDVATWGNRLWAASASRGVVVVDVVAWRTRKPAQRAHGVAEGSNMVLDGAQGFNALHTTVETAGKGEDVLAILG